MLSAFQPQAILELKQRDKSKIESVLAYGDRLLVGLNTGVLRIYRVDKSVELLREEEKFSKRPIQQLAIIKEANILVSLSDSYVSIHDLQTFTLQERLDRTKGATVFAVTSNVVKDPESGVPGLVSRLAVAVKRRIVLWTWQDMELASETGEIALQASIKSLTWASGTRLVAGMDPGYSLVDIESGSTSDITKPGAAAEAAGQNGVRFGAVSSSGMGYMGMSGWVPKPMATQLAQGSIMLAKDVNTLFIDNDGKALEKRQIPWANAPEAIGYSYPYLLSLQPATKGGLDVRNPDTLSLLQSVSLPNASLLHVPQPNISLAHAGKGFLVASDRCVWRMAAQSYEDQIDQLVSKLRFDEAISLLNMLEDTLLRDKSGKIREVMMLKAQSLFEHQKYRPALDLFAEASAPPERVVALYPKAIAGDLSSIEEPDTDQEQINDDVQSDADAAKKDDVSPVEPPSPIQKSMFGKLKHQRNMSDTASIRSVSSANNAHEGKRRVPRSGDKQLDKPLVGSDLKAAVLALCSFLAQSRVQIQKYLGSNGSSQESADATEDMDASQIPFRNLIYTDENVDLSKIDWQTELKNTATLVDTTLFRAYMFALPSLAGPLFRLDNYCDPKVVEEKLYESGRYNDLIDFLHGKKLHREALELLEKFGRNEAAEEVMPALRGPSRTVGYLQQLPPDFIDIILEFAEWPIKTEPRIGMEVFLADTETAESLPRDRVLTFLGRLDQKLALQYLEHMIVEWHDETPRFHQELVDKYLSKLKGKDFASDEDRNACRTKLEDFLQKSNKFNKVKTFQQLPSEEADFFESRAIVLSAMGNHKQALSIYVFQIKDVAKAEAYCNRIAAETPTPTTASPLLRTATTSHERPFAPYDPEDSSQPNIYTVLLGLYLKPPSPHQVSWPPALDLLSKHGARLPASSTLELMPDDLAVTELELYFRGRIRNANSVLNEERMIRALEGVRKIQVERDLFLGKDFGTGEAKKGGRSRRVVIRDEDHCRVCHKRFGSSAIRVWPDGEVVHYGCVGGRVKRSGGSEGLGTMKRKESWTSGR